jgi:hypothetical protein
VAALPRRRDAYAQDEHGAAFHPRGLGGSQAPRRNPPQAPMYAVSHEPAVNHIHEPRLQAISDAIMLARLAYDGKLAANLTREDNRSGPGKYDRGIWWKSGPCARGGRTASAAMRLDSKSRWKKSLRKNETANTFPPRRRSRLRRISRAHDN